MGEIERYYQIFNCVKKINSFGIVLVKKNYSAVVDSYEFFKNLNTHRFQEVINFLKKSEKVKNSFICKIIFAYFRTFRVNKKVVTMGIVINTFFNTVGKNIAPIDYLFNILLLIKKNGIKCI